MFMTFRCHIINALTHSSSISIKMSASLKLFLHIVTISTVCLHIGVSGNDFQSLPCTCKDQSHCDYLPSWNVHDKEVIVATEGNKKTYDKWLWDSFTTVLALNDGTNQDLMCYTHSKGKKYGITLDVPNTRKSSDLESFGEVSAATAHGMRADVLSLNFMKLLGDCENAKAHVDDIINITKTAFQGIRTKNKDLKVLCVLPWQPPCYSSDCGITPVMANLCDGLILNMDSFDTYCDKACIAKPLVPYTKIIIAIQEYTAMGFNVSQILLSIPWHGFRYTCSQTDIVQTLGNRFVCHLNKTVVEGKPDVCHYESSRERINLSTLIMEHPHLAYDEATYSGPDQAPFYYEQNGNESYLSWFEMTSSLTAKYRLVNDWALKGMVLYTGEDLTYGAMASSPKDRFDASMWNWVLHTVLLPAVSGPEEIVTKSKAGMIAGIGVGMFLFGCLMGGLIACVIFRRKRKLNAPFQIDKLDDEYRDDDSGL